MTLWPGSAAGPRHAGTAGIDQLDTGLTTAACGRGEEGGHHTPAPEAVLVTLARHGPNTASRTGFALTASGSLRAATWDVSSEATRQETAAVTAAIVAVSMAASSSI